MRPTLRVRLFASYSAVAVVGAVVLLGVMVWLAPRLFDDRVAGMGLGRGRPAGVTPLHEAFRSALTRSLAVAVAASLAVAVVAAVFVARHLLRPVDGIRAATRRLAAGHYDEVIPLPAEPELAALVSDVNTLSESLATGERRRAALIGDVAHEMRTPLTTIRGYIDGLSDGMFSPDEAVAAVTDEVARLERLSADLAAVSRAEEGMLALNIEDVDVGDAARAVVDRLRPQFTERDVDLVLDNRDVAIVRADHHRLIQAVTNMVGNALAYTPPGGSVHVTVQTLAGAATLAVADTGAGLASADLDRVFERFYRVDPTAHAAGTGVGLTIARAVARAHGGDLTAASPGPGRGSTFTLTIPTAPAANERPRPPAV